MQALKKPQRTVCRRELKENVSPPQMHVRAILLSLALIVGLPRTYQGLRVRVNSVADLVKRSCGRYASSLSR